MKTRILLTFLFVVTSICAFAQASWSYNVKFKLVTKGNKTITYKDFKKGRVKMLSEPLGAHADNNLAYDSKTKSFVFSQHTIATNAAIVFIYKRDTTVLLLSTTNLDLGTILLSGEEYFFHLWIDEKKYVRESDQSGNQFWQLSYPLEAYINDPEKLLVRDIERLVKVDIE